MTPHRLLIIVNKTAAQAREVWPRVQVLLKNNQIQYDHYETSQAGDATGKTREALRAGARTVAVVAGDGTLSEVAEGFFVFPSDPQQMPEPVNSDAALAILPAGTGDDFARGLIGHRASLERWIVALVHHCQDGPTTTRPVDVLAGACDNFTRRFICLNASTMGIGGETAARVAAQQNLMRSLSGEARFMVAAIGAIAAWRERPVRVTVDEQQVIEGQMNLVAVANGLFAGGGMNLSPQARVDDGKLDVVTASGLSRAEVVRELPRIHSGGHVKNPKIKITQGRLARIETFTPEDALLIEADGNIRGKTPVEFRVMPRAIRFVV